MRLLNQNIVTDAQKNSCLIETFSCSVIFCCVCWADAENFVSTISIFCMEGILPLF